MWKANIFVTLKEGVLDPQGQAVLGSLRTLGFDQVKEVGVGKFLTVELMAANRDAAADMVDAMCKKLLANPVIEEYRFELTEVAQ